MNKLTHEQGAMGVQRKKWMILSQGVRQAYIWVGIEWCIGIEFIPNTENCIYGGKKLVKGIISSGNMRTVVSYVGKYLQQNDTGLKISLYKELLKFSEKR